jgi:signal transduction histidine kinase
MVSIDFIRGRHLPFRSKREWSQIAFNRLVKELRELGGPNLRLTVIGEPRTFLFFAADETYLIAREAIGNAMRHSLGGEVWCDLRYEENELLLIAQDNGA